MRVVRTAVRIPGRTSDLKLRLRAFLGLAVLTVMPIGSASAQNIISEVRVGVLAHDLPIFGHQRESGPDINGELLFVSPVPPSSAAGIAPPLRWLLTPRPNIGVDANTAGDTSQLYFGLTWTAVLFRHVLTPQDRVFFSFGFGPAFNNGHIAVSSNHKGLGSNVLFHPSAEIGYWINRRYSISLYYEHSSSAGLANPNEGLNNAGVRFGLRF